MNILEALAAAAEGKRIGRRYWRTKEYLRGTDYSEEVRVWLIAVTPGLLGSSRTSFELGAALLTEDRATHLRVRESTKWITATPVGEGWELDDIRATDWEVYPPGPIAGAWES